MITLVSNMALYCLTNFTIVVAFQLYEGGTSHRSCLKKTARNVLMLHFGGMLKPYIKEGHNVTYMQDVITSNVKTIIEERQLFKSPVKDAQVSAIFSACFC